MEKKIRYLLVLMIFNSSCFLYNRQSIEQRLNFHQSDIRASDTRRINFNGIYMTSRINQVDNNRVMFDYYRFFPDGKVFNGQALDGEGSKNEVENNSDGYWTIYYIKSDKIYIEQFSGYGGYQLRCGYFNKENDQILFNYEINPTGKKVIEMIDTYKLKIYN